MVREARGAHGPGSAGAGGPEIRGASEPRYGGALVSRSLGTRGSRGVVPEVRGCQGIEDLVCRRSRVPQCEGTMGLWYPRPGVTRFHAPGVPESRRPWGTRSVSAQVRRGGRTEVPRRQERGRGGEFDQIPPRPGGVGCYRRRTRSGMRDVVGTARPDTPASSDGRAHPHSREGGEIARTDAESENDRSARNDHIGAVRDMGGTAGGSETTAGRGFAPRQERCGAGGCPAWVGGQVAR
jgi:hypothetical protein